MRFTFISNLVRGGVHPKTVQALARHSTIVLTMDRYSHSCLGDMTAALDVLPDLNARSGQRELATGTHGRVADGKKRTKDSSGGRNGAHLGRKSVDAGRRKWTLVDGMPT